MQIAILGHSKKVENMTEQEHRIVEMPNIKVFIDKHHSLVRLENLKANIILSFAQLDALMDLVTDVANGD